MVSVKVAAFAGFAALFTTAASAADLPELYAPVMCRMKTAGGLVSARRHRHDQPAGRQACSTCSTTPRPRSGRCTRNSTARRCSASASATSSTTGCASMSPANIAATPTSTASTSWTSGGTLHRRVPRQQVRVAGACQRLCRSRHLVFVHAVHRRRRRRIAQPHQQFPRCRHRLPGRRRRLRRTRANTWNFAWALHAGSPTGSRPTSRSSSPIATSTLATLSAAISSLRGGNLIDNPMEFRNITSHDLKFGVRWMLDAPSRHAAAADAARLSGIVRMVAMRRGAFARRTRVCARTTTSRAFAKRPIAGRGRFAHGRAAQPAKPSLTMIGNTLFAMSSWRIRNGWMFDASDQTVRPLRCGRRRRQRRACRTVR